VLGPNDTKLLGPEVGATLGPTAVGPNDAASSPLNQGEFQLVPKTSTAACSASSSTSMKWVICAVMPSRHPGPEARRALLLDAVHIPIDRLVSAAEAARDSIAVAQPKPANGVSKRPLSWATVHRVGWY
jgi:hypothetical protein